MRISWQHSRNNLKKIKKSLLHIRKVLEEHQLSCIDLLHLNTDAIVLTKLKAEKVVGWAKNHYLLSCLIPSVKGERLCLPRESLKTDKPGNNVMEVFSEPQEPCKG